MVPKLFSGFEGTTRASECAMNGHAMSAVLGHRCVKNNMSADLQPVSIKWSELLLASLLYLMHVMNSSLV